MGFGGMVVVAVIVGCFGVVGVGLRRPGRGRGGVTSR